jgi:hypothetical protein
LSFSCTNDAATAPWTTLGAATQSRQAEANVKMLTLRQIFPKKVGKRDLNVMAILFCVCEWDYAKYRK